MILTIWSMLTIHFHHYKNMHNYFCCLCWCPHRGRTRNTIIMILTFWVMITDTVTRITGYLILKEKWGWGPAVLLRVKEFRFSNDGRLWPKSEVYLFWPSSLPLMSGSSRVAPKYLATTTASVTWMMKLIKG